VANCESSSSDVVEWFCGNCVQRRVLAEFFVFSLFYMETYKHILEILTINKVCLFMSYDTMDYLVLCNMV